MNTITKSSIGYDPLITEVVVATTTTTTKITDFTVPTTLRASSSSFSYQNMTEIEQGQQQGEQGQQQQQLEEEVMNLMGTTSTNPNSHTMNRNITTTTKITTKPEEIYLSFLFMSIFFALNHGCVVACLGLATSQLGTVLGGYQSSVLYFFYILSSILFGSTYYVKQYGSRNTLCTGMGLYCLYVFAFYIAAASTTTTTTTTTPTTGVIIVVVIGAIFGGIGAGFLWTAQGTYYASAVELYSQAQQQAQQQVQQQQQQLHNHTSTTTSSVSNQNGTGTFHNHPNDTDTDMEGTATMLMISSNNEQSHQLEQPQSTTSTTTSEEKKTAISTKFASIFAFIYLAFEVSLRLLSSFLLQFFPTTMNWVFIFAIYTLITILSTFGMYFFVPEQQQQQQHIQQQQDNNNNHNENILYESTPTHEMIPDDNDYNNHTTSSNEIIVTSATTNPRMESNNQGNTNMKKNQANWFYQLTIALRLFRYDTKMKYFLGLNFVFGFTAAFLNSYVNGNVIQKVLHDPESKYVGIYTAWISIIAAISSLFFGTYTGTSDKRRGYVLTFGSICFLLVVLPFYYHPTLQSWTWYHLFFIYTMHGLGRATFESTLKSTFASYFAYEKEGAFANIVFQNGTAGFIGYYLSTRFVCNNTTTTNVYCIQYQDGTYHDVYKFEMLIIISAIVAILGYWRAYKIHHKTT